MKTFGSWLNAFLMLILFTVIIDIGVYAPQHSVSDKAGVEILIPLSILLSLLVIRTVFILTRKNKNKR